MSYQNGEYNIWCKPNGISARSKNTNTQTPSAPAPFTNAWNPNITVCTLGHTNADKTATGISTKNPIININVEPLNVPNHSGNSVSKNLLCK